MVPRTECTGAIAHARHFISASSVSNGFAPSAEKATLAAARFGERFNGGENCGRLHAWRNQPSRQLFLQVSRLADPAIRTGINAQRFGVHPIKQQLDPAHTW